MRNSIVLFEGARNAAKSNDSILKRVSHPYLGLMPQVQGSGQDVLVNAGTGGTVRVTGTTCASMDLCAALDQISTITNALATAVAPP